MRKSPTPSASTLATDAAPATSPMLRSSATGWPSAVRPGPRLAARAARRSRSRRFVSAASSGAIPSRIRPAPPSTSTSSPSRRDAAPGQATMAGMPEAAGQDRGVARRSASHRDEGQHALRGQRHGVGRCQVVRDEHERRVALGHAGHRLPEQPRDRPVANVVEVPDALGHVPAEVEQQRAERIDGAVDGPRRQVRPWRSRTGWTPRATGHGRSSRSPRAPPRRPGSTLAAARRSRSSAVAPRAATAAVDLRLGVRNIGAVVGQSRPRPHERDGPRRLARTHADPLQRRGRRRRREGGGGRRVCGHAIGLRPDRRGPRRPRSRRLRGPRPHRRRPPRG